jgi:hypothetical protein
MTTVSVSGLTSTVSVTTDDNKTVVVPVPVTTVITATTVGPQGPQGAQGLPGESGTSTGSPTFIQTTQPTSGELGGATKYAWWDTSGGDLTLWIEDGI